MVTLYKLEPDYAVHPGKTLKELLEEKDISPKEFAIRAGKPEKTISEIINGKSSITPEMAVSFESVLRLPASFWLKKQANYNEYLARKKYENEMKEAKKWLKNFPYLEMAKRGWVKNTRNTLERIKELFFFFQISSPQAWDNIYMNKRVPMLFRKSLRQKENPYAVSALLRASELEADKLEAPEFDKKRLRQLLPELKNIMITEPSNFLQQIQEACLQAGVKVVYLPHISKSPVYGVVRYIKNSPVILLTDRLKRYDIFWFSFFHELGHVILHDKKKAIFLEEDHKHKEPHELEADAFAVKQLLSEKDFKRILEELKDFEDLEYTLFRIRQFASQFETHPSIIIGRILRVHKDLYQYGFLQKKISKISFD